MTAALDLVDHSPATLLITRLVRSLGTENAHQAIDEFASKFSVVELAAIEANWEFWAATKQLPPPGDFVSWGFIAGRGKGKTRAITSYMNGEIDAGRAPLVCLMAQDEQSAIDIQVLGKSGLIATAPPWNPAEWEASALQVVWRNGARAYVRTPEVPGKVRGLDYHLGWATEIQSWPTSTREEAFSNFLLSVRLGHARHVWDATPKRRHPILRKLIARAANDPRRHVLVRGSTYENAMNLSVNYIEELEREYGKGASITQRGREEVFGEMLSDSDAALVKQKWIDDNRRERPKRFLRKVLGVDPAVTSRAGSDDTGIVLDGLAEDGQLCVLGDWTGKHDSPTWSGIVLRVYVDEGCDLIVVETNKGGNLLVHVLRAAASALGLTVVVVDDKWAPHVTPGTVYVREIHSRGPKEDRAQPLATAYERNRVSHIRGVDLTKLEDTLTTWEPKPGERSPDGLDAHVHASGELLGFRENKPNAKKDFEGIAKLGDALLGNKPGPGVGTNLAAILGSGRGGRI